MEGVAVPSVPVSGTWLRHTPAGAGPLGRPPVPADGRWQRGTVIEGIYLAAEESTVWAEWYRWLAEHEVEPLRSLPRELWRYRANLRKVADLTSTATLTALELPTSEPNREQWPAFQRAGEQLHAEASRVCCIAQRHGRGECVCACSGTSSPPRRASSRCRPRNE